MPRVMLPITAALLSSVPCPAAELSIEVRDDEGRLIPCRMHLQDAAGKPVKAPGLPFWRDHFVCAGEVRLELPDGRYHYEVERGPEYARVSGDVQLRGNRSVALQLDRIVDLRLRGWHAGDLHVHRPLKDVPLLMRAEDLDIAPVITWWNRRDLWRESSAPRQVLRSLDRTRFYHVMAGEDEREGGALLYFGMPRPIDITQADREFPSPLTYLAEARAQTSDLWLDIEKPFWWDVPVWLALARPDSIGLANNHMCRSQMLATEAWGRPRDSQRLPPPRGNGYWTQEIYYHILNAGFRIPPSAGSASGVLPNPVGYNRVYVHTGAEYSWESWWRNLRAGRCFVTNGPLLLCRADGHRPGHVFESPADGVPREVTVEVDLTSLDEIRELEVISNGRVVRTMPATDAKSQRLSARIPLPDGGWFLVRAITTNQRTFRFASTAPFYVGAADAPRISRRSVDFFLTWIEERIERVTTNVTDVGKRRAVLEYHEAARKFWQERRAAATDD